MSKVQIFKTHTEEENISSLVDRKKGQLISIWEKTEKNIQHRTHFITHIFIIKQ